MKKKRQTKCYWLHPSFIPDFFFLKHTDTKSGYTYSSLTRARDIISIVLYKSLSINNLQGTVIMHIPLVLRKSFDSDFEVDYQFPNN